jgi:hypothetical protein
LKSIIHIRAPTPLGFFNPEEKGSYGTVSDSLGRQCIGDFFLYGIAHDPLIATASSVIADQMCYLVRQDTLKGKRGCQEFYEASGYYNLSLAINR